jgi:hypothetical protein
MCLVSPVLPHFTRRQTGARHIGSMLGTIPPRFGVYMLAVRAGVPLGYPAQYNYTAKAHCI